MHNPYARYRKEFTIEDVLNSPMVAYPIRLYGICSTSDGAAAAVLSSTKVAKKFTNKPITIPGIGAICPEYPYSIIDTPPRLASDSAFSVPVPEFSLYQAIAKKAYEEAGLGPEDIDTADFYDGTGVMELNWYEHFGLCAPGEAERLLNDGDTEIGGRIPVNTSGGLSSLGEAVPAQAIAQVAELVWQLRGDAGARQVEGAKVGITANLGAQGSASSVVVKR
jgi:acetyl-CoA acetyltransferase